MLKKSKIFLLAAVLVLAFAQMAFPALTAVGPVVPDADGNPLTAPWAPPFQLGAPTGFNGFPTWYRDSLGQTLELALQDPLTIWDPVIVGNAFSDQIQFGSEAMYWTGDASIPTPAGSADLIMALECAFNTGDAAPGEQIVFSRIRIRIDTDVAGTYTVFHPYGTNTFTVAPADVGTRAINFTSDIGIGAPGDFTGALKGDIGPFLRQVAGAPAGYLGDGTFGLVTGSPIPSALHPSGFQNFFRVEGPLGFGTIQTNDLAVTGKLFTGTPFNVTRGTFSRDAGGAAAAEVFANFPAPFTPGTAIRAVIPGQPQVRLTRSGTQFFGRVPFTAPFTPNIRVRGLTNGTNITDFPVTLVDVISVIPAAATYTVSTQTLTLAAVSTDAQATLSAYGWIGALGFGNRQPLAAAGGLTTFINVPIAPPTVTVVSTSGGTVTVSPVILP